LWLHNAHIAGYQAASYQDHEPNRSRKLLLHRKQIDELAAMSNQKGLTLVPLKLYIKKGIAKLELGVARGKRFHDKRETIAQRESDRVIERALKRRG
jgi:SsrA-binding protein